MARELLTRWQYKMASKDMATPCPRNQATEISNWNYTADAT